MADGSRWRLLWAGIGAVATIGGVIGAVDWGHIRFFEEPREEKRQEQLERTRDAGASSKLPGQQEQVAEAVGAAKEGAQAGDERFTQALDLLKAGKRVEAAALFRTVAEEKTQRIEQNRLEAAAAWRHAGAMAGLDDPKTARDAYRRAVELQSDNAEAQLWHGWFEMGAGGLAAADAAFRRVLALAEQGVASDEEAIWAWLGIGDVLVARGELGAALKSYHNAFATTERLAQADPHSAAWQRDLSVSHERLGDVLAAQGQHATALDAYRASLAIRERLAQADPSNAEWQRDLSISHDRLGDVLVAQGQFDAALQAYRAGLAIRERLAQADPRNAEWQRDLLVSFAKLGSILELSGDLAAAADRYEQARKISVWLSARDPSNATWRNDRAWIDERIATVRRQ